MWWYRGEAKVAGQIVAEAEVGAMITHVHEPAMNAIDPTARIAPGAAIGAGASIGPYCVIGPDVVMGEGCRLVAHVHVTGHTTIGPRTVDLSLRLAGHAAAIREISRRADPARDRRRLRYPRERHHQYRHRGRPRHHRDRRPLLPDGRLPCRPRLQGRQPCDVRQQCRARRPCQRRRLRLPRRPGGGAPVRPDRRGRA